MSVTSANIHDLQTFVDGESTRVSPIRSTRTTVKLKANSVAGACEFQHPSTHSADAALDLLNAWRENANFVKTIRQDLVDADNADVDGNATVSNATVANSLAAAGLTDPPDITTVPAIELQGQPPYSGFKDDPISMANGNFLFRDGDIPFLGVASVLSVVRAYNSRDDHVGPFGPGWTSALDVSLSVGDRILTFRGPDGGGAELRRDDAGAWHGGRGRDLRVESDDDGWTIREGHDRSWRFDPDGTLVALTALAADVTVERSAERITLTDATSGRSVTYHLTAVPAEDHTEVRATSVTTSDGRSATYDYDDRARLVAVHRDLGLGRYTYDDNGFLATIVDADGVVVCRNTYDEAGRVVVQVEEHGRETSYEYGTDGVATITAADGSPPEVMVHDRRGRMTAMIDGLGHVMRVAYDDGDRITQIVDRAGAVTRYAYDERGNAVRRVDPDGLEEHQSWDGLDRLVARTDRAGATTRFVYEGVGRDATRVVQADGTEVHFTYDDRTGLPTSVTDPDGVSATLEWDRDGLLTAVTDALGGRIEVERDDLGRTRTVELPEGIRSSAVLDAAGRLAAVTDAAGVREFQFSEAGRLLGGRDSGGTAWRTERDSAGDVAVFEHADTPVATYDRDGIGRVVATTNATGDRTRYEYDPLGRRTAVVDALGHRTETTYDPEGRVLEMVDPSGRSLRHEVDELGRTVASIDRGGERTERTYHPGGQVATATDADGRTWRYDVDVMGRVVSSTDPAGAVTTYRYTPGGRLAEVRSPLGRTIRRRYDAAGRLAAIVEPDGTETVFERRSDGSVARVLRDGVETSVDHDETGRASAIAGPWNRIAAQRKAGDVTDLDVGGLAVHFEHDERGLLQRATDAAGVTTEFAFDPAGRLLGHVTRDSSRGFTWDPTGRMASITDPHGATTRFERDARGWIETILYPDGTGVRGEFGDDGHLRAMVDLDGNPEITVERGPYGRLTGAADRDGGLTVTRDALGRVASVTTDVGTVRYERDADGDLVAVADDDHEIRIERDEAGTLLGVRLDGGDLVERPEPTSVERGTGGRISVDEHGRRYRYDLAGRLAQTTLPGGLTTTYEYDDLGLLSTEHTPDGVRTYHHGPAGELLRRTDETGAATTYAYDDLGRRIREVAPDGTVTRYRWNLLGRLVAVTRTGPDGDEVEHRIERDPLGRPMRIDDVPIRWDGGVGNGLLGIGDERFAGIDGHVRVLTDPDDDWNRRVGDDPWGDDGGTGVRLGYRGELALDGLLLLGDRAYDSQARTFLSPDPLSSRPGHLVFAGVYAYAANDPVNLVDPNGRAPLSDDEYNAWKEANTKGFMRELGESIAEDPWGFVAKAAIAVGGIAIMAVATATLGPVGLIVAGALVGAVSGGLNAAIDGKTGADFWRDVAVGGIMGGLTGPLGRIIPTSSASSAVTRLSTNTAINAAQGYGGATATEALNSYLPGGDGDMDWGGVVRDGTISTIASTGMGELQHQLTVDLDDLDIGLTQAEIDADLGIVTPAPPMSMQQLTDIDGIGDTLAQRIMGSQNARGGASLTMDQLLDLDGIGPARAQAVMNAYENM